MTPKGLILVFGSALVLAPEPSPGQKPPAWPVNVRAFRTMDGLPESACISATLAPHARVLARHLKSNVISQLDGYTVTPIPAPEQGNGRIYESPGGQLWTVVQEGLYEFRNGAWVLHPVPEISAEFRARPPRLIDPLPLHPVRQDVVLFLLPDRLVELNVEDREHPRTEILRNAAQTRLDRFSGLTSARDGALWLAGARGLAKSAGPARALKPDSEWQEYVPPEALQLQNLQQPRLEETGLVTVMAESGTNGHKVLAHFDGQSWTAERVPVERARFAWRGPDETDWGVTADSLFEWDATAGGVTVSEEDATRQCFDLAVESSGAFWLATSDGLFRYAPLTWRCPGPARKSGLLIHSLTTDESGRLWFIAGNSLHLLDNDRDQEFPLPALSAESTRSRSGLYRLKDGSLWVEAGGRPFQFHPATRAFTVLPIQPTNTALRPLGLLKDSRLCLQVADGGDAAQALNLQTYDGVKFEPFLLPPPDESGLGSLSTLFAVQNGDLWVGGERGTAWQHDQQWHTFTATDQSAPHAVVSFAESSDGRIWCATQDKVWRFNGQSWSAVRVGLDRINALLAARDGSLWVATDSALYRSFQGAWVENGMEEGLPSGGVRELYEDLRGRIWAGTAHGLSLYHPEADPDPPRTYVEPLGSKEHSIPEGGSITLLFGGVDKWKYTSRQRLLYSYRLSGRDWSPFQEDKAVSFGDLPAGKHDLQVRSMDRNCNIDPSPARFEFVVVLPWYKESRLVLIALLGLAVALFFAGLAFNRHRQLLRSYAAVEEKVAQRTRELELANRQLLHSQKMTALGTLAAGIAHDFNNILSIVKGSAQIIEDNLDNPDKVRTRVDRIKTVVEQGAGIVKAMLGFSRDSTEPPGPCDLNTVLDETLKLLGDRFLREAQITLERAPGLPGVVCSKDFVQQTLLNFIFNAAESMEGRKQIVLATRRLEQLPPGVVLAPAAAGSYVAVSVQDHGCGIPPEHISRIFEPFFTTKAFSARRGTGLGLSMAYELARKMEAGIAVESTVDQGSTFTLILPVRS